MLDKNQLLKLKEDHDTAKEQIDSFEKDQLDEILELSTWLQNLISGSERLEKTSSTAKDKDPRYMWKLRRKKEKLNKETRVFEATVSNEIEKGAIPTDIGEKMLGVVELLKLREIDSVGFRFDYFKELLKSKELYHKNKEKLAKEKSLLEMELGGINKLIRDKDALKDVIVDTGKVKLYEEYLSELKKLERFREKYIKSLLSLKVVELIEIMKKDSFIDYGFPKKDEKELDTLHQFFKEDKFFSGMNIGAVCDMFVYSDEKVRHLYPEVSKFKKIVRSNKNWFEKVYNLKNSDFAVFNDKSKEFYYGHVLGAKEIIDKIGKYENDITVCKAEYEKGKNYEAEKKKLSVYSKQELEKQFADYTSNLNIILSDNRQGYTEKTVVHTENSKKGIFDKLKSIFNIGE